MDARAIATEMAPVIMWQKERKPETYRSYWNNLSRSPSKKNMDPAPTYSAWDMLSGESLSQTIYLHYTWWGAQLLYVTDKVNPRDREK